MGLESGTTILDLDATWPLSGDLVSQGDDHLKLIKSVLKSQFPGAGGQGLAIPIIATEDELNFLSGATSNIQLQIDGIEGNNALSAPLGTTMLFIGSDDLGAYVPAGWQLVSANNDVMLRIVSTGSASGSTGGTHSPIAYDYTHAHTTGDHTLTNEESPRHSHIMFVNEESSVSLSSYDQFVATRFTTGSGNEEYNMKSAGNSPDPSLGKSGLANGPADSEAGDANPHNHGNTSSNTMSFRPRYINTVQGVKV